MLFEPDQLPVVRIGGKTEAGLAGKSDHGVVRAQGVAEQTGGAERGGPAFQIAEQGSANAVALPAVVDRQAELETLGVGVECVAGLADNGGKAVDLHGRHHAEAVALADMDEAIEYPMRQFLHRAEEAIVTRARRQRAKVGLQLLRVARLQEAHRHRGSTAREHHVRILLQVVEPNSPHGTLLRTSKGRLASLTRGDASLAASSRPPKRLFDFVRDVAPGNADVVHVALGPLRQLAALPLPLAPDKKGVAELGQNSGAMMIYHLMMRIDGHFSLLKLSYCSQYLRYIAPPQ